MNLLKIEKPKFLTICFCMTMLFVYSVNERYFSIGNYFYFPVMVLLVGSYNLLSSYGRNSWKIFIGDFKIPLTILYVLTSVFVFQKEYKSDVVFSYILLLGMFYVMTLSKLNEIDVKWIMYSFILSGLVLAILLLSQMRLARLDLLRFTVFYSESDFYDVNFLGGYIAIPALLSFYKGWVKKNSCGVILYKIATTIMIIAVLLTGSRGAMLGFLVGVGILLMNRKMILQGLFLAGLFVLLTPLLPDFLYERLFENSYDDGSNSQRIEDWMAGLNAFVKSPLLGNGCDWPEDIIYRELRLKLTAHNTYITFLMHFGIIGIGFLLSIFYPMVVVIVRNKNMRGLLAMLASLLFISIMIEATLSIIFYIPLIVIWILYNYKKNNIYNTVI